MRSLCSNRPITDFSPLTSNLFSHRSTLQSTSASATQRAFTIYLPKKGYAMSQPKLKALSTTALLCLVLLFTAINPLLEGQARPGDNGFSTGTSLTPSTTSFLQRRRTRRRSKAAITGRSYINVEGIRVPSPRHSKSVPAGASAQCGDGTYSFSRNRRGTCSRHGGVARWL